MAGAPPKDKREFFRKKSKLPYDKNREEAKKIRPMQMGKMIQGGGLK